MDDDSVAGCISRAALCVGIAMIVLALAMHLMGRW